MLVVLALKYCAQAFSSPGQPCAVLHLISLLPPWSPKPMHFPCYLCRGDVCDELISALQTAGASLKGQASHSSGAPLADPILEPPSSPPASSQLPPIRPQASSQLPPSFPPDSFQLPPSSPSGSSKLPPSCPPAASQLPSSSSPAASQPCPASSQLFPASSKLLTNSADSLLNVTLVDQPHR